jgi:hypothetical protein
MLRWKYEAIDESACEVQGEVDAPSVSDAMRMILRKGELPTKILCINPGPWPEEEDKGPWTIEIPSR